MAEETITIGVHDHRLVLHAETPGITLLGELQGYIGALSAGVTTPRPDGTDSVALQSAKLDLAEMVEEWTSISVLALEELEQRSLVDAAKVPERPPRQPHRHRRRQLAYIQAAHRRAEQRLRWLEQVDMLLREQDAALLPPALRARD